MISLDLAICHSAHITGPHANNILIIKAINAHAILFATFVVFTSCKRYANFISVKSCCLSRVDNLAINNRSRPADARSTLDRLAHLILLLLILLLVNHLL